jgi:hypothetical protein
MYYLCFNKLKLKIMQTQTAKTAKAANVPATAKRPKLADRLAQQTAKLDQQPAKVKEIIAAFTAKGHAVTTAYDGQIGITLADSFVNHWFTILPDQTVMFDHTYSSNTGKTFKGVRHMLWAYRMAERITGLSL